LAVQYTPLKLVKGGLVEKMAESASDPDTRYRVI